MAATNGTVVNVKELPSLSTMNETNEKEGSGSSSRPITMEEDQLGNLNYVPNHSMQNYGDVLREYGLEPHRVEFHWQVGRTELTQGWLLHISIIRSQLLGALTKLVPFLVSAAIPFRIVQDYETAINVLDGNLGAENLGKIITIYPPSDAIAVHLARELAVITSPLKGPNILTDIHLGGCVYTRYGGFGIVMMSDAGGNVQKFIYGNNGELMRDIPSIPFRMPEGIKWPFSELGSSAVPAEKKILHGRYKPLDLLKTDPRGHVIKAHYLTPYYLVKTCVIKQARRDMWSDNQGRDMADRLLWQEEIYHKLKSVIQMPRVLEVFEENGDTYLAMEFIKAKSVFDHLCENINPNCEWFQHWRLENQQEMVDYLMKICKIIQRFHENGLVHRDTTPVNFLISRKKELVVIDCELAYSLLINKPEPPFEFGTQGFMSPEQALVQIPTEKEDIYGLGATILTVLTGIPPLAFDVYNPNHLEQQIAHFIQDSELVAVILACLSFDRQRRPMANLVANALTSYKARLSNLPQRISQRVESYKLSVSQEIIQSAIKGLVNPPMTMHKGLWETRQKGGSASFDRLNRGFAKSGGLFEGIAGILYTIAEAGSAGFDVSDCALAYDKNFTFLRERYLNELPHLPPGLSGGSAGMAMAISSGIHAGFIESKVENRQLIQDCLNIPHRGLDIADGSAGIGMAAIECAVHLNNHFLSNLLIQVTDSLQSAQDESGNWLLLRTGKKKPKTAIMFSQGNTGINLFLLKCYSNYRSYYSANQSSTLWNSIHRSLESFRQIHDYTKRRFQKLGFRGHLLDAQLRDGFKGMILNYLKAFEITKDNFYMSLAEDLLLCYPPHPVHEDFSLQQGLAGLGCLYLEAFTVSKNHLWKERANWIECILINTCFKTKNNAIYWLPNNQPAPTADLMSGNCGILYFLLQAFNSTN